jgi:hypothetical protein
MKARLTPAKTSRIAALRLKGCKPLKKINCVVLRYRLARRTIRHYRRPPCNLKGHGRHRSTRPSGPLGTALTTRALTTSLGIGVSDHRSFAEFFRIASMRSRSLAGGFSSLVNRFRMALVARAASGTWPSAYSISARDTRIAQLSGFIIAALRMLRTAVCISFRRRKSSAYS